MPEAPPAGSQAPEPEAYPPLKPRQVSFVHEYLIDQIGSRAAERAGLSPHTVHILLSDPAIKAAIAKGMAQKAARAHLDQDTVLHEMSLLSHSSLEHYIIADDGQVSLTGSAPDGAMRAIQSIKRKTRVHYNSQGEIVGRTYDVEIRLWDKVGPLKLMGRHVGLFPDRVEHTGKNGGPIQIAEERLTPEMLEERSAKLAEMARFLRRAEEFDEPLDAGSVH